MSESLGDAVLTLRTDNAPLKAGLSEGLASSREMVKGAGEAVRGMGMNLALASAPIVELGKIGLDHIEQQSAALAQSKAVVKSLGDTTGITAHQITTLAESTGNLAGVTPESVQAGENLLVTLRQFPGTIQQQRTEFSNATLDMANYAARMNVGPTAAARMLAKEHFNVAASTLQVGRASLSLTPAEDKLAKSYTATHNAAGILALQHQILTEKMGGAAKAAGDTLGGQIQRLKTSFDETAASIMKAVLPDLQVLFGWIQKGIGFIQGLSPQWQHWIGMVALAVPVIAAVSLVIGEILVGLSALMSPVVLIGGALAVLAVHWAQQGDNMNKVKAALAQAKVVFQQVTQFIITQVWPRITQAAQQAMTWFRANVLPTIQQVTAAVKATLVVWIAWGIAAWKKWGSDIMAVVKAAFVLIETVVKVAIKVVGDVIALALAVLSGRWGAAWSALKSLVSDALNGVVEIVKAAATYLLAAAKLLWSVIGTALSAALSKLGALLMSGLQAAWNGMGDIAGWLLDQAEQIGTDIVNGIVQGIQNSASDIGSALKGAASSALSSVGGMLGIHSPSTVFRDQIGMPISQGIAVGIQAGLPGIITSMNTNIQKLQATAQTAASNLNAGKITLVSPEQAAFNAAQTAYQAGPTVADATKTYASYGGKTGKVAKATAKEAHTDTTANHATQQAQKAVKDANARLAAAEKSKSKTDDGAAAKAVANAKANLKYITQQDNAKKASAAADTKAAKASQAAAKAQIAASQSALDAMNLAQQQLDAAEQAADDAAAQAQAQVDAAQAAADAAQAAQDQLTQGLQDIKDAAGLALSKDDLADALTGGNATSSTLSDRIAALKSEYNGLQSYLTTNAANLDTTMTTDVFSTMAGTMGQINDLETQLASTTNAANSSVNSTATAAANADAAVTRLSNDAGSTTNGNLGGQPLIGSVTVNHDTDVPNLIRRIAWNAKQVGAY